MIRVLLTTPHPGWPIQRQLPRGSMVWGDCEFHIDEPVDEVDAWVVFENLTEGLSTRVAPQNTLLVTGEPPAFLRYRTTYYKQFRHVVTCHAAMSGPTIHLQQQGLPWHIGIDRSDEQVNYDWTAFSRQQMPVKKKLISVICSNKTATRDHVARRAFVEILQKHFGDRIDVFGRGYNEVGDKWEAIAPYRFHVVLENDSTPHYFSEKLTDCLLGWAYPFYYGAPNVEDYFDRRSLTSINIHRPEEAILLIESGLQAELDRRHAAELIEARNLVLNRYNLFAMLNEFWVANFDAEARKRRFALYPRRWKLALQMARIKRLARAA